MSWLGSELNRYYHQLKWDMGRILAWKERNFGPSKKRLEEILADPEECYSAGIECARWVFNKHADQLVKGLDQDPHYFYLAGKNWSNKRFDKYGGEIAEGVSQSPEYSYLAGRDWSYDRSNSHAKQLAEGVVQDSWWSFYAGRDWKSKKFEKYADQIVGMVTQFPEHSELAGRRWSDEKFEKCGSKLAEGVSQSPEYSYKAGKYWKNERVEKYLDKLVNGVAKSPRWSYESGEKWSDEKFDPHADQIIRGVLLQEEVSKGEQSWYTASKGWKPERVQKLWTSIIGEYNPGEVPEELDFDYIKNWFMFAEKGDLEGMAKLPLARFNQILETYSLIQELPEEERGEVRELFFEGFSGALEKGNVKPWAEYVLKHFNDGAIGGGNYRMMGVVG